MNVTPIPLSDLIDKNQFATKSFEETLQDHSFAIITLDENDAKVIEESYNKAKEYFENTAQEDKWKTSTLFNELNKNKGLAGYNVPNPAKELYRIRRGSLQPWPENSKFRSTIEQTFEILEKLVNTCTSIVTESFGLNFDQLMKVAGEPNPIPHDRLSASPFDLFYYHNRESGKSVVNCSEHVDPGFMTCVPCAPTPGLAVFDTQDEKWIQVENYLQPFRQVTVFCDQVLAELSQELYLAAIHRVDKNDKLRLSLVYELRPRADYSLEDINKLIK